MSRHTAADAYVHNLTRARQLLADLERLLTEHADGRDTESHRVDWRHVAELADVGDRLEAIATFLRNED